MAEYSYPLAQTVAENSNLIFLDGERCCKKGYVTHRDGAGIFRLKGSANSCKSVFRVTFNGNVAVATGGVVAPISIALQEDGETLQNAVGTVTPTAVGDFFNVSLSTFIVIPCGCCVTISVQNVTDGSAIDVINSNLIIERVA